VVTIMASSIFWQSLIVPFLGGVALGLFFFAGLWWTVNRLQRSQNPGLLFAASFVVRTAIVVAGIYFLTDGMWQRIAASLIGFVLARAVLTRRWGSPEEKKPVTA
jgi:F1F0 ATPase subunit 2